jgi:glutathione peroxidase
MVVNVASKCKNTPQYEELETLYRNYKGNGFEIIAFPANNFLWQEPGDNQKIKEFCTTKYQVSFKMMAKISVKGKDMAPVYHWLTEKQLNGFADSKVKWNFQKYLINEDGALVGIVPPGVKPDIPSVVRWIETGVYIPD